MTSVSGLPVFPVYWGDGQFDGEKAYDILGLEKSLAGWGSTFSMSEVSPDFIEYLGDAFKDSLVILFEGNPIFKMVFNYLNIPYVDVVIHPVRFMPNLLFGVKSNVRGGNVYLQSWAIDRSVIEDYAGYIKAGFSKRDAVPELSDATDVALLFLQTDDDRSVVSNGKFLSVEDFQEEISLLVGRHRRIIIKRHPLNKNDVSYFRCGLSFRRFEETDISPYKLFYLYPRSTVYAISSSVCHECKFFGVDGRVLYRPPFEVGYAGEQLHVGGYSSLYESLFRRDFWYGYFRDCLSIDLGKVDSKMVHLPMPENFTRIMLNSWWGYDKIFS
ncbi:hypothetical protein KAK11_00045 [Ideonella paludis]|uniref:Capsule polysaccharide biosynthesis protein n=1 Tax=Ideonella paludis TaxID=1233411 RepID=A0ABS5DRB1_9BURK|nr:hypothetical protein [Ideonella paludis]